MIVSLEKPPLHELAHYGVLGMKWGVRKPEETGPGRRSSKQTRMTDIQRASSQQSSGGLTDKQKKYLKLAGLTVAAGLVIYGGYKLSKSGGFQKLISKGANKTKALGPKLSKTPASEIKNPKFKEHMLLSSREIDTETGFSKLPPGKDYDIKKVNPEFSVFNPGTSMNCGNSTIAVELRKRGLDVMAKENPRGLYDIHMGQYFNLADDSVQNVTWSGSNGRAIRASLSANVLKTYPEGARGSVIVPMRQSNHFVAWSIQKGKVVFEDGQDPGGYNFDDLFEQATKESYLGKKYDGMQFVRLDNAKINTSKIREVVRDVSDTKYWATHPLDSVLDVKKMDGPNFTIDQFDYLPRTNNEYDRKVARLNARTAAIRAAVPSSTNTPVTFGKRGTQ